MELIENSWIPMKSRDFFSSFAASAMYIVFRVFSTASLWKTMRYIDTSTYFV